ncbi:MAG: hypothetical protein KI790_20780 [Cyclobacteriaceae bacterium]|nr:hypothetical protein [Cyclobacteriaceae bacterium HetDA_MAG_MS6]
MNQETLEPIVETKTTHKIKLISVHCTLPDEIDKDEMYLKYKGKKVWPRGSIYYRVDTGDVAPVGLELEVEEGWTEVELWDFDYLSRNDFLGTFRFKVDDQSGSYSTSMTLVEPNSTASYILKWEILN